VVPSIYVLVARTRAATLTAQAGQPELGAPDLAQAAV
jgi:hypothetical protein